MGDVKERKRRSHFVRGGIDQGDSINQRSCVSQMRIKTMRIRTPCPNPFKRWSKRTRTGAKDCAGYRLRSETPARRDASSIREFQIRWWLRAILPRLKVEEWVEATILKGFRCRQQAENGA